MEQRVHREFRPLLQAAIDSGWRVREGTRHVICYPPDTSIRPIALPGSPSGKRTLINVTKQFERAGLK